MWFYELILLNVKNGGGSETNYNLFSRAGSLLHSTESGATVVLVGQSASILIISFQAGEFWQPACRQGTRLQVVDWEESGEWWEGTRTPFFNCFIS